MPPKAKKQKKTKKIASREATDLASKIESSVPEVAPLPIAAPAVQPTPEVPAPSELAFGSASSSAQQPVAASLSDPSLLTKANPSNIAVDLTGSASSSADVASGNSGVSAQQAQAVASSAGSADAIEIHYKLRYQHELANYFKEDDPSFCQNRMEGSFEIKPGINTKQFKEQLFTAICNGKYKAKLSSDADFDDLAVYDSSLATNKSQPDLDSDYMFDRGNDKKSAYFVIIPNLAVAAASQDNRLVAIDTKTNDEFGQKKLFEDVANEIVQSNSQILRDIWSYVEQIYNDKLNAANVHTFMFIECSSGTGKTQSAYDFKSFSSNIYHIVAELLEDDGQEIYKTVESRSASFLSCVDKDYNETSQKYRDFRSNIPSIDYFNDKELYTYAFLKALFSKQNVKEVKPCKAEEIYPAFVGDRKNIPVIFLDEFPPITEDDKYYRFMRTILRGLKLVLIIMGTNYSGQAIMWKSGNSSRNVDQMNSIWCIMIPRLPPTVPFYKDHGNVPEEIFQILQSLALSSRPRFGHTLFKFAFKYFEENPNPDQNMTIFFNNAFDDHFQKICHCKSITTRRAIKGWLKGQVCSLLNAYNGPIKEKIDDVKRETSVINQHFPLLYHDQPFKLYFYGGIHRCQGNVLDPNGNPNEKVEYRELLIFPQAKEDSILYFSIHGGSGSFIKENVFFYDSPLTTRSAFIKAKEITDCLNFNNIKQPSNDGMFLEAMSAAAICVASHFGGIGGSPVRDFIENLLYELDLLTDDDNKQRKSLDLSVFNESFLQHIVPYFSPPDKDWPEFLFQKPASKYFNVANFGRSSNVDKIDFSSEPIDQAVAPKSQKNVGEIFAYRARSNINANASEGVTVLAGDFEDDSDDESLAIQEKPSAKMVKVLSGEGKDHANGIGVKVMTKVMNQVNVSSNLHIVIASRFQNCRSNSRSMLFQLKKPGFNYYILNHGKKSANGQQVEQARFEYYFEQDALLSEATKANSKAVLFIGLEPTIK